MDNMKQHRQHDNLFRFEKLYKRIKHIIVSVFIIGVVFTLIILLAALVYFHQLTKEASSISDNALKHKVIHFAGDDLINYKNKDILYEYDHSLNPLIVGPKHVNPDVIKALTSSEDTLFFQHNGILPKAILRAMFQDLSQKEHSSGGSTITQQLVKNQVLTNEKTYSRKANEIILAQRLEDILSKKEIIYTYLNIVPFGRDYNGANITGISSASYSLFGVSAEHLNIAQSAYLIGLLQSPYGYTPYDENGNLKPANEIEYSIQRQHYVLKRMLVEEKITKAKYQKAKQYNIKTHLLTKPKKSSN